MIDSLRADRMAGFQRTVRTPHLDELAAQGTCFSQAVASSTVTTPCVGSMLTGLYPFAHGIRTMIGYKLDPACRTLPEILSEGGYHTMARVTGPILKEVGLARGFQDYGYRHELENLYSPWRERLQNDLATLEERKQPWFLFLHLWELHISRYFPPGKGVGLKGAERYDRCLEYLDEALGRVLKNVCAEETLVVVQGDHGDNLEKPFWGNRFQRFKGKLGLHEDRRFLTMRHGYCLYDMLVRVPLILFGPNVPRGLAVAEQVRQVDIMPTLLSLAGVRYAPVDPIHGKDLVPLMQGVPQETEEALLELCLKQDDPSPVNWLYGIRTPEWKYLARLEDPASEPELYHLTKDPREGKNMARRRPNVAAHLHERLLRRRDGKLASHPARTMSPQETDSLQKSLKQLGYLE